MSVIYRLQHPVTVKLRGSQGEREETVEEVEVREPRGKDMRVMDKHSGEAAQSLAMIAQLTGLPIAQVDEMHVVDVTALGNIIEGFTKPGPRTGETS